jgi:hypothetical protein
LRGIQKKYWELCAELYPPLDEELIIDVFSSGEVFLDEPEAAELAGNDDKHEEVH